MPILANPKHEAFAQKVATGMPQGEAYRQTIGGRSEALNASATRLVKKVKDRIQAIQVQTEDKTLLTITSKRVFYHSIVYDKDESTKNKLRATQLDSELAGHIQKDQQAVTINNNVSVLVMTEDRRKELIHKKRMAIERRRAIELEPIDPLRT